MIMWHRTFRVAACIAICASAAIFLMSNDAEADFGSVSTAAAAVSSTRCPGPIYQYDGHPIGVPAIVPRSDCTPSFTRHDVIDYLRTHPFPNKGIDPKGLLTVTEVAFIPVQDIPDSRRLGSFDLPRGAIVCYVELHGPVIYTSLATAPSSHITTVYVVFDARSGNLLASGG